MQGVAPISAPGSAGHLRAGKRQASDSEGPSSSKEPSKRPRIPQWSAGTSETNDAVLPAAPPAVRDEIVMAAPKLAEAIRSAAKCVKVAEKVASLLEGGMVNIGNTCAIFEVLSAATEDPMRWRKPAMHLAFCRLFGAAASRLNLFPLQQQQSIKVWQLRVVTLIDLLSNNQEHFNRGILEVTRLMQRLPCANPADEPRSSAQPGYSHLMAGARNFLPERARPAWSNGIFECLEVSVARFEGPQLWARGDVNALVKLAVERRQNFTRPQQEVLDNWEAQRKSHWATRAMDRARSAGL